jgi:prepilin-type N-terminal cleavage/methylation domain-containing protein
MDTPRTTLSRRRRSGPRPSHAFTLTELLVAVAVFVVILLAAGKIFSTTSRVTSVGEATADILQEAAVIERQMRADLSKLSYEGVFVIRCTAVPNDLNVLSGGPLLDSSRPPDAFIRADQLLFFANGVQGVQTFKSPAPGEPIGSNHKGQGTVSRIYYGHAFQLAEAGRPVEFQPDNPYSGIPFGWDPYVPVYPWTNSAVDGDVLLRKTKYRSESGATGTDMFEASSSSNVFVAPIDARNWLFARQPVVMVDDDESPFEYQNAKTVYLIQVLTGRSLFLSDPEMGGEHPQFFHGRVDAVATQLDDLRRKILYETNGALRNWDEQRDVIIGANGFEGLLQYPRAERTAPSMHRVDQALTNHVIGSAVSDVKIDWMWDPGTGYAYDDGGEGFGVDPGAPTPWFGLPDPGELIQSNNIIPDYERGVGAYGDPDYRDELNYIWAQTIFPDNVETITGFSGGAVYEAIFGFNQTEPLQTDPSDPQYGQPDEDMAYTPWPNAIRVTLRMHSPNEPETAREVQFVIDLPGRPDDSQPAF